MNDAFKRIGGLLDSIRNSDPDDVYNNPDLLDDWVTELEAISEGVEKLVDKNDDQSDEIGRLKESISDLESELADYEEDDASKIEVEVNGLPDQMKLEHLQEVFDQYTLEEFESLIPRR